MHGAQTALSSRPPSGRAARRHGAQCRLGSLCPAACVRGAGPCAAGSGHPRLGGWRAGPEISERCQACCQADRPRPRRRCRWHRRPAGTKANAPPLPGTQPAAPGGVVVAAARAGSAGWGGRAGPGHRAGTGEQGELALASRRRAPSGRSAHRVASRRRPHPVQDPFPMQLPLAPRPREPASPTHPPRRPARLAPPPRGSRQPHPGPRQRRADAPWPA